MNLQEMLATIEPLDQAAMAEARERQAQLAKPPGSLGRLEDLSIQVAASRDGFTTVWKINTFWSSPPITAW